ncbi:MAG: hypothetical protein QOG40_385 [Solirubrobacteraceae bacterium]|nr:hypothetical protein [Solirubrobacteraceae bacterium]
MVAPARRELATTNRDVASGRCLPGARRRRVTRGGLRIGETLSLRWRDVDLPRGTITVQKAKTDAGVRAVKVLPVLQEELGVYRPETPTPTRSCSGRRRVAARARRMSGDEYWHRPSSWPRAAREARGAAAAGGPNTALAPANVRVAAVRDWSGAAASDEADGAHQRKSHARGLRARHGRRRRARAATSPRWVDNAQQPVAGRHPIGNRAHSGVESEHA